MGSMTGSAVFCCGWMKRTVTPVLGDLTMAFQTEGGLPFFEVGGVWRTMTAMASIALELLHRLMLDPVAFKNRFNIVMAGKTNFAGFLLHESGIIRAVRGMTRHTFTIGKRWMGIGL